LSHPIPGEALRQGAVLTALKKIGGDIDFVCNPANPNQYPVHYVFDLDFEVNLRPSAFSCEPIVFDFDVIFPLCLFVPWKFACWCSII
jgi:hypothetical protein